MLANHGRDRLRAVLRIWTRWNGALPCLSLALCLLGCGETSPSIKKVENMAFVPVATFASADKPKALDALNKLGILTTSDPLNANTIDVLNTDLDRAKEIIKHDSEDKGYAVIWPK